jgi:glycosyltransferase involved in cell wall biosynthesis
MPESLLSRSKGNLSIRGEVTDLEDFLSDKHVAVVPLFAGSGMRVKIVEALYYGKVVITTQLGATGIPYTNGKNILIADTANEFIEAVNKLSQNLELIRSIGIEARRLVEQEFDLKKLSSKLTYFYANI